MAFRHPLVYCGLILTKVCGQNSDLKFFMDYPIVSCDIFHCFTKLCDKLLVYFSCFFLYGASLVRNPYPMTQ